MTTDKSVESRVREWLEEEGSGQLPGWVLQATFERTSADRRRRSDSSARRRNPAVNQRTKWAAAVAVAAVIGGLALVALQPRLSSQVGGVAPASPTSTDAQAPITGRWVTDATPALNITVPVGDSHRYYWRAVAYDEFNNTGWTWTTGESADRAGGATIFAKTAEGEDLAPVTRAVTFGINPLAYRGATVFSPATPDRVDTATRLTLVNGDYYGTIELANGSSPYQVTALVPATADDTPSGLTANQLRSSSQDYPASIADMYLDVPAGAVGPAMTALKATIERVSPSDDPYDLAQTAVSYLRSTVYTYTTDVTDLDCGSRSIAECFAQFKKGYCQYYATTMAMLMRMEGIPTRYVQGFLPGERDVITGTELIRYSNSHAWVEVYFTGYGWVTFDPTGGGVGRLTAP